MTYKPQIQKVVEFLAEDLQKPRPSLANTLFTSIELKEAVGLAVSDAQLYEIMVTLEFMHFVSKTNKVSPTGYYYNVAVGFYESLRANNADVKFVAQEKNRDEGFCIFKPKVRVFRQTCAGRKCPFFLAHEKKCVLGKFFMK